MTRDRATAVNLDEGRTVNGVVAGDGGPSFGNWWFRDQKDAQRHPCLAVTDPATAQCAAAKHRRR
jgi:hypothetical protein